MSFDSLVLLGGAGRCLPRVDAVLTRWGNMGRDTGRTARGGDEGTTSCLLQPVFFPHLVYPVPDGFVAECPWVESLAVVSGHPPHSILRCNAVVRRPE